MYVEVVVSPQQATAEVISPVLIVNAQVAGSFQHNSMLGIQGGITDERYHLSAAELANFGILVGGGDTALHYHSADRARANHTGTQLLATISDAGTMAGEDAADYVEVAGDVMTGALSIVGSGAADVQLTVKGAVSQSANLQEWQNSSGGVLASVDKDGNLFGNNAILSGTSLNITGSSFNFIAAGAMFFKAGVANRQLLFYGANEYARFDSSGRFGINVVNPISQIEVDLTVPTRVGQIIKGAVSQSANLQEWQDSSGTVLSKVEANGTIRIMDGATSILILDADPATRRMLLRRDGVGEQLMAQFFNGAAIGTNTGCGWTFNGGPAFSTMAQMVTTWEDGSGDNTQFLFKTRNTSVSTKLTIGSSGNVLVNGFTAPTVGLTVKGAVSQTANLQEWQDSSGSVQLAVDKDGALKGLTVSSGSITLREGLNGKQVFRGLRATGWSDSSVATFFQSGDASQENILFTSHNAGVMGRVGFSGLNFQFSPASITVFPIPSALVEIHNDFGSGGARVPLKLFGNRAQTANMFEIYGQTTLPSTIGPLLLAIQATGHLEFQDGVDIIAGTTTGTKIGTATSQKFAFHNATPVVQETVTGSRANPEQALADLITKLANKGIIADGTAA